jgi:hypothetical protein
MTTTMERQTQGPNEESPSPSRRRWGLAAGVVALVIAGATLFVVASDDAEPRDAQPTVVAPQVDDPQDLPQYRSTDTSQPDVQDLPRYRR